ncbi:hypothetical protein [Bradyrhizobium sp. Ash2021]|uniref:hypothetical protein n=1 Tax=Bradyrhizobium sp. Ash2021 TaxID=2954771 RepID=UPI0028160C1C|nr:hypothetical protein [Bradyrhizobium sp. Ash2021]WMT79467.1 hypothetical protein NL528_46250 [Bradyrhizobium sp. Ash2021]
MCNLYSITTNQVRMPGLRQAWLWHPGVAIPAIRFKRGTFYRAVVDTLRRATGPMTADDICQAPLAGKTAAATRKQEKNLQAAILAALRVRNGKSVVGEGAPARWRLKEDAN